jgi:putative transposase
VNIHHRNSIRLRAHDYTSSGAYFVTVCAAQKQHLFGDILEGEMALNDLGRIVLECWNALPEHFPNVALDEFVVMPNHVHGIVLIERPPVGARHASPLHATEKPKNGVPAGSLGAIVGSFKSAVTKRVNESRGPPGVPVWQRNYHERIIRSDRELEDTRRYVTNNPLAWALDEYGVAA